MTAAHVVRSAAAHGQWTIGGPTPGQPMLGGVAVQEWEIYPERDVALMFCKSGALTLLNVWMINRAPVITDLSAFGYPHAVTKSIEGDRLDVVFRAYKGHVITTRGFDRLPGKPAVYEVSCPYPEGLSGAPVLIRAGNGIAVAGVVGL